MSVRTKISSSVFAKCDVFLIELASESYSPFSADFSRALAVAGAEVVAEADFTTDSSLPKHSIRPLHLAKGPIDASYKCVPRHAARLILVISPKNRRASHAAAARLCHINLYCLRFSAVAATI